MPEARFELALLSKPHLECGALDQLGHPGFFVFSDSNKLTLFITKVFGYRPGNNSSAFNVSTHEGAGTFQALANKELTSPKANWASGL
ncbi:hypothetical protein H8356DRAFT_1345937 [Neocallimastix lanati (nom. inval.)]|nr:hypothetical protein H8356DRAFT_1345937 [Neocallimastix sp. JGI-2020a]